MRSTVLRQPNLLSLNAAIEAARKGEIERGFVLVETEGRSLVKRSQTSISDIKNMTDRLNFSASLAVKSVDCGFPSNYEQPLVGLNCFMLTGCGFDN
ncbi:methyl-accepting chemotaxis protein [Shewanella oneidensis]|uniref:methyl-accepting chemotaxis protein n=1 Tax=Shewanella oneidensis TaxID=70863 RepID=UPI0003132C27|nr:methyl-accepting chemotaxis protein [Shewanella oneidensis]MDX5996128.1 methyl-accepting chemotaxis protein [Shewanella oneidensis]